MKKLSKSFVTGTIALVFAVLGYQTALLVHYAAVSKVAADRDCPDTVYVFEGYAGEAVRDFSEAGGGGQGSSSASSRGGQVSGSRNASESKSTSRRGNSRTTARHNAAHGEEATKIRRALPPPPCAPFRFDPNTVSAEDLMKLGFSEKQAASIDNYRRKGGRFRRKEDFAKSFVVSEEKYERLKDFIDIPKIDLNEADSAAFDSLPGIGGWFAAKMVSYRHSLGGYSRVEQLMEIKNFDREKYEALRDLVTVSKPYVYPLWELSADSLAVHPYIGKRSARSIAFYREHNPREDWTVDGLMKAGILSEENARRMNIAVGLARGGSD